MCPCGWVNPPQNYTDEELQTIVEAIQEKLKLTKAELSATVSTTYSELFLFSLNLTTFTSSKLKSWNSWSKMSACVVLFGRKSGIHRENPSVQIGDHKPSHILMPWIEPITTEPVRVHWASQTLLHIINAPGVTFMQNCSSWKIMCKPNLTYTLQSESVIYNVRYFLEEGLCNSTGPLSVSCPLVVILFKIYICDFYLMLKYA